MASNNADIIRVLKENDIRPSYTRIRILEYLKMKKTHPPAEEIYNALVGEIPTLSRTTVYNTLSLLDEKGVIRGVTIEDNEKRFDFDTTDHGHFKCSLCGKIFDFSVDICSISSPDLFGFKTEEKNVYFKGICNDCLDKNK